MADVTGQRTTSNVNQSQRAIDMREAILLLEPSSTPLTVFSAKLSKARTKDPLFKWTEDQLDPRFTTASTSYNTSATSIVVAAGTGTYFAAGDLVRVTATGETFRVSSVSTDTLTVARGIGNGGTGIAISSGGEFLILGSNFAEGVGARAARSSNPTVKTNYTAIVRDTVSATRTQQQSDQLTSPNDWAYQRNKKGIEHAKNLEYQTLLSHPSEDTSGSTPIRTSGGAYHFLSTNITAVGGTLTETSFWNALRTIFRYKSSSDVKVGFASSKVVQVLNMFPTGRLQIRQDETTYGVRVFTYLSPFGTLRLVYHPLLEGAELGGHLLVLDMEQVRYRYLSNENGSSDTHIRKDIQAPDVDGATDEYLTEFGLEFGLEKMHGLLTGIAG